MTFPITINVGELKRGDIILAQVQYEESPGMFVERYKHYIFNEWDKNKLGVCSVMRQTGGTKVSLCFDEITHRITDTCNQKISRVWL